MDAMRPSRRLQTLLIVLRGVVFVAGSVLVEPDPNERITYTTNLRPNPVESLVSAESRVPEILSVAGSSGYSLRVSGTIVPETPPSPGPLEPGTQVPDTPEPNTGADVDVSGLIRDKRHGGWGGYGGGGYGGGGGYYQPVAVIAIGGGGGYGRRHHRHHGGWGGGGYGGYPGGGYGGYPGGGYGGGYGGSWSQSYSQSSSGSYGGGWGR